jgi:hypothetical protein
MPPRTKKARTEVEAGLNWNSLPVECQHKILHYADVNALCALDATCISFQTATNQHWGRLAQEKFGIQKERGKLAWRQGMALVKPKHREIFVLRDPEEYDCMYAGSPQTATNGSILVHCSDDMDAGADITYAGNDAMVFRDAKTLSFMRTRACAIPMPWKIAICGPEGAEVIVTSNISKMAGQQGNRSQEIVWDEILKDKEVPNNSQDRGTQLLGSETHLIALFRGNIHIFIPGVNPLLSYASSVPCFPDMSSRSEFHCEAICWASDEEVSHTFALSCQDKCVSLWKLDVQSSQAEHIRDIQDDDDEISGNFDSISLSNCFVACSRSSRVYIFDRESGKKLHNLCDLEDEDKDVDFDTVYPLTMEAVGDLLVTTSIYGCALCVWQMRTGTLLRRYEDAFERRIAYRHPEGSDVASMVRLKGWDCTAFVTNGGGLMLWAFPEDTKGKEILGYMKTWVSKPEGSV